MKKLLPSAFLLIFLNASGQAPEALAAAVPASVEVVDIAPTLELVSFEAYVSGTQEQVLVRWATASERPQEGFLLERSADLQEWSPVLELGGEGRPGGYTPYEVEDPEPLEGISYYRLLHRENGAFLELSDLFSISRGTRSKLLIHPEQAGRFTVKAVGTLSAVRLMDNRGQFIPMALDVRMDQVVVNTELLTPGTYYVQAVVDGDPVLRPVIITPTGILPG